MTEIQTNEPQRPLAVSVSEAARLLGLSKRSVENYIAAKRLVSRKAGRRTLVLTSSLSAFLRHDQPSPAREVRH